MGFCEEFLKLENWDENELSIEFLFPLGFEGELVLSIDNIHENFSSDSFQEINFAGELLEIKWIFGGAIL